MGIFNPGCRKGWEGDSQKQVFPGKEKDGAIKQFCQQAELYFGSASPCFVPKHLKLPVMRPGFQLLLKQECFLSSQGDGVKRTSSPNVSRATGVSKEWDLPLFHFRCPF